MSQKEQIQLFEEKKVRTVWDDEKENTTEHLSHKEEYLPTDKDRVLTSIKYNGFTPHTLQLIDKYITDIQNGTRDLLQFNQPEHAGVCSAGPLLIGSLVVCDFARESFSAGSDASGSQTLPTNWQISKLPLVSTPS